DNPMDSYTPSPAELAATGTATPGTGSFRADTPLLEARFSADPGPPPPPVFRDIFEADVQLETPAAGFPAPIDLVFPGVLVSGTSGGSPHAETSEPMTVTVAAGRPPNPVPAVVAVKSGASDVRVVWGDAL